MLQSLLEWLLVYFLLIDGDIPKNQTYTLNLMQTILQTTSGLHDAESIMAILRQQTRASHEHIERVSCLARLFASDYRRGDYRDLLARLHGFYEAIESALYTDLPVFAQPVLGHRRKSRLIVRDLQALEVKRTEIDCLPLCFKLPSLHNYAARMGVFYVLEGATLGGQLIRRRLLEHFGVGISPALNFYGCYGEKAGLEWRTFRNFMADYFDDDQHSANEVVSAANATFDCLRDWLEQN